MNLYTVAANKLVSRVDPLGKSDDDIGDDLSDPNSKSSMDKAGRCKPKNCPPGTVPIDEYKKLTKDQIHQIKQRLGLGGRDWVGIDPKGNVVIDDGLGNCENMGPWSSYGPFTK